MCGIHATFNTDNLSSIDETRRQALHVRGPDEVKTVKKDKYTLTFHRLSIVGQNNGSQPFETDDIDLMCNGEIYNSKFLTLQNSFENKTESDCEVIIHMYKKFGIEYTADLLDGEFAFILIDRCKNLVHFARDRIGVKPLYLSIQYNKKKCVQFLEISSLIGAMDRQGLAEHVKPGFIYTYDMEHGSISAQPYSILKYMPMYSPYDEHNIYASLSYAVRKRIDHSERPIGFLLSGGLDSSLILALAMKIYNTNQIPTKPKVFTFGFSRDAPDVKSAELMVTWLRTKYGPDCLDWHLVIKDIKDGLDALPTVIKHLETYDTTTIRASVPMYLLSKYIAEQTDVKVVLSGEGSDELFGGYLYFKYAPNDTAFRSEIISLLENLYLYDALRADRCTAANGLELRPPFLDAALITTVLESSKLVKGINNTKELLRNVIHNIDKDLLPAEILWGKKEAFSDAVGLSWKDSLTIYADKIMKDADYECVSHIDATNNEMLLYQMIFEQLFSDIFHILPKLWLPNQVWVNTGTEPSARVLDVYTNPKEAVSDQKESCD